MAGLDQFISSHPLGAEAATPLAAVLSLLVLFVLAFLLGSIPWGVIISRAFFKKDIRNEGSGNIGATNAMRAMGKKGGVAVFLLDFVKGVLAGILGVAGGVFVAVNFSMPAQNACALALLGCALGHIFCPWLGWKGGKGISVAFGCLIFAFPPFGAPLVLLVFLIAVVATRRISCGSIAGAICVIALGFYVYWGYWLALVCTVCLGGVVIWAHRANIKRIIDGSEPRIGSKKQTNTKAGDEQ